MNSPTERVLTHIATTANGSAFYGITLYQLTSGPNRPSSPEVARILAGAKLAKWVGVGVGRGWWPAHLSDQRLLDQVDFATIYEQVRQNSDHLWQNVQPDGTYQKLLNISLSGSTE